MSGSGRRLRILYVEDEFLIRMAFAETLLDEGFDVSEAETGDDALHLLESGAIVSLLVTDIHLPGAVGGVALVQAARARTPDLPVIYMTGRMDAESELPRSVKDAVLQKPCLPSDLVAVVRRLLDDRVTKG